VPFLCDFPRALRVYQRRPYDELTHYLAAHREREEAVRRTLSYLDGVSMARRAACPALFAVALEDTTCPPSTVFGAFNAWAGADRDIAVYRFNNHEGGGPFHRRRQLDWLRARV